MARNVDEVATTPSSNGWNMITNARVTHNHPSLAAGVYPTGLPNGALTAAGSPGASLGTGMNSDLYIPTIET